MSVITINLKTISNNKIQNFNNFLYTLNFDVYLPFKNLNELKLDYDSYLKEPENWPDHMFPREAIKSFNSFLVYWNNKMTLFCNKIGTLCFDTKYERTSEKDINLYASFILMNLNDIKKVENLDIILEKSSLLNEEQKNLIKNHFV